MTGTFAKSFVFTRVKAAPLLRRNAQGKRCFRTGVRVLVILFNVQELQ